ncbi:hypothetical protein V3C99_000878 [Haemonchus contortus]
MLLRLLAFVVLLKHSSASFCGTAAVPFSFEVMPNGQPVLGCARPQCFRWAEGGSMAEGQFHRIKGRPDGFFRSEDIVPDSPPNRHSQYNAVECQSAFESDSCDSDNEWVGGIVPLLNVSAFPIALQCCTFEPLRLTSDRGVATVNPGQVVIGGEVLNNEAFDYISNVQKEFNSDGSVTYKVGLRRFYCPPKVDYAPEVVTPKSHENSVQTIRRAPSRRVAFQAPIVPVEQPIAPNAVGEGEDVIVEEEIAQEGVEIPDDDDSTEEPQIVDPPGPAQPLPPPQQLPPPQPFQPPPQLPQFVAEPIYYPAVAPAPVAAGGGGGGGGGGGYYCFTGDAKVRLITGVTKRLDDLKVNDWVQTLKGAEVRYAPVTFWLHRVPSQKAEFVRLELSDGTELKLTAKHFIYRTKCTDEGKLVTTDELSREAVLAEKIVEGDCLYQVVDDEHVQTARVTKISSVIETGIFSPMTSNGRIVVNGIYASCHNIVQSNSLQNTFFSYADRMRKFYASLFSTESDVAELPMGMDLIANMLDLVIPKDLVTL